MGNRGNRRAAAVAAAALTAICGGATAPALADDGRLAEFDLGFATPKPSSPTGMTVHLLFRKASDPEAKPSPLRAAQVSLPDGSRIDTTTLPQCTATDQEFEALGSEACPDDTRLTVGAFSAITGFPPPADPFMGDLHIFNG